VYFQFAETVITHLRVAFLQCIPVRLKGLKSKETDFEPQTLGEHLKKRRLILKLYQREVAERLGVDEFTVLNWEKGKTEPPTRAFPAILTFLGYNPLPKPETLSGRLQAARRLNGWTSRDAGQAVGVNGSTWDEWEQRGYIPKARYRLKVEAILVELGL
jgi:transcriptional regulator with XRE-family HTH domain